MTIDTTRPTLSTRGCRTRAELDARVAAWRESYVAGELRRAGASMIASNWPVDQIAAELAALRIELEEAAELIEVVALLQRVG